jgi:hypothetical protein
MQFALFTKVEYQMPNSVTVANMKLSPRLIHTNPVNGRVAVQLPTEFVIVLSQLLNTMGKRSDYFATCISCEHWKNQCTKFNCMPPPEVIANGCEFYDDKDYVPF